MKKNIIIQVFSFAVAIMTTACQQKEPIEPTPAQPKDRETVLAYGGEYRKTPSKHFINQYITSDHTFEAYRPGYTDFYQTVLEESGWIGGPPLESPRKIKYANQPSVYSHFQLYPDESTYDKYEWSDAYIKEASDSKSEKTASENFNRISESYDDTGFNDSFWSLQPFIKGRLISMTLTCDKDFDDQHPAGTSLNDIALIIYYTAEPFIKSGYTDLKAGIIKSGAMIDKLDTFNNKNLDLLLANFVIGVIKTPKVEGEYTYKLKYKFEGSEEKTVIIDGYSLYPIFDEFK